MRARASGEEREGGMSIFGKKHKLVLAKKIAITDPASLMGACGYPHHALVDGTSICPKSKKLSPWASQCIFHTFLFNCSSNTMLSFLCWAVLNKHPVCHILNIKGLRGTRSPSKAQHQVSNRWSPFGNSANLCQSTQPFVADFLYSEWPFWSQSWSTLVISGYICS